MAAPTSRVDIRLVDDLTKVLPSEEPDSLPHPLVTRTGQSINFQVAWHEHQDVYWSRSELTLTIRTDGEPVQVCHVDLVAAGLPAPADADDGYLATQPSLLPDLLTPLDASVDGALTTVVLQAHHMGWNAVWVSVPAFSGTITVTVTHADSNLFEQTVSVTGVDLTHHDSDFINTQWLHPDCLGTYFHVPMWSEQHWHALANHVRAATQMGVNSLLTPIWSPPLDTAVGTYRPATQLLDISYDGTYHFATERLDRWVDMALDAGIRYLELPHLFTQWGAHACPQFIVKTTEGEQRRFGWDTEATSPKYRAFVEQLIPFLIGYFRGRNLGDAIWWHISDEPDETNRSSYQAARKQVIDLLEGQMVGDALSDPDYIDLVDHPIVATTAVTRFREAGYEPSWVYYCVGQANAVANRFIAQRPIRHRMLGLQLFCANSRGFLHWAFDFYYSQLSVRPINPFADSSAGGAFFSGDPFVVYPADDLGVYYSLRYEMLRAAFEDLVLFHDAAKRIGREEVLRIMDPDRTVDFSSGWISEGDYLARRARLFERLAS